jgi:hypothetical protein
MFSLPVASVGVSQETAHYFKPSLLGNSTASIFSVHRIQRGAAPCCQAHRDRNLRPISLHPLRTARNGKDGYHRRGHFAGQVQLHFQILALGCIKVKRHIRPKRRKYLLYKDSFIDWNIITV